MHDILIFLSGGIACIIIIFLLDKTEKTNKLFKNIIIQFLDNILISLKEVEQYHNKEQIKKRANIEFHLNNILREANRSMPMNKSIVRTECIILKNLYLDK